MTKRGISRSNSPKSKTAKRTPAVDPSSSESARLHRALSRAIEFNQSQGLLTWWPSVLERTDDFHPPTPQLPRLFISYAWGDFELESWMDVIVSTLVDSGYRVVYDRDPRNFERELSKEDVLRRMDVCNYFVAVISERFGHRTAGDNLAKVGAATHEWEHAIERARQGALHITAIWFSGHELPPPFSESTVIDMRPTKVPNEWDVIDKWFPNLETTSATFSPPVVPLSELGVPLILNRSSSLLADRYRLVTICAWRHDGTCNRLGPYLIRQLERVTAELNATGGYSHFTTEAAGVASD
jgi:hypothetical protein